MSEIALFLCDKTGIMAEEWLRAGVECWLVDIQHPPGITRDGLRVTVGADVRTWQPPLRRYRFAFAFPPCTHLSVSGARWFKTKGLRALSEAIDIFGRCVEICEWTEAAYGIENPVSTISSYYRHPDHTFQPWQYGDLWTKKTCLWTGGGFVMPVPIHNEPPPGVTNKIWKMPPSVERANLRSETPRGFARAVYRANVNHPHPCTPDMKATAT